MKYTETERSIDLYLIVGQSNAAGYTKVCDRAAAYTWAPELKAGYPNVYYAGNARADVDGYTHIEHRRFSWQPVTLGLGVRNETYFGPEAGMAKAFSSYYNAESGREAGIIKFAHGGTSLLDSRANGNRFGNWVSPSYAKDLGIAYDGFMPTGGLYRDLLAEVRQRIVELKASGRYTQYHLRGLYWMQGEGNRMFPSEYRKAFAYWASDIRRDLAQLMRVLGVEADVPALPIFVGTISATFSLENTLTETMLNLPFVEMQKGLAREIPACYLVDNANYAMGRWDASENRNLVLGTDNCHWNQADMLAIGENVGKAMLCHCLKG